MSAEPNYRNVGDVARAWWEDLRPRDRRPGDRAGLAELRRSADPLDLAFVPAFGRLRLALGAHEAGAILRAARIAHVLAHVRDNDSRPVARALGPQADGDAPMSEARFRRLLQAADDEDLIRRMVRAVKMLKQRANVADLAEALWFWNDRVRRDWAFRYLNAEPPADDRGAA